MSVVLSSETKQEVSPAVAFSAAVGPCCDLLAASDETAVYPRQIQWNYRVNANFDCGWRNAMIGNTGRIGLSGCHYVPDDELTGSPTRPSETEIS